MDKNPEVYKVWAQGANSLLYCQAGDALFYLSSFGRWTPSGIDTAEFTRMELSFASRESLVDWVLEAADQAQQENSRNYWCLVLQQLL